MPSFPRETEPLSDGSVTLRPAAERDIPEVLIAYQDDPELHRRMGEGRPPSAAELGRRAERAEHDRQGGVGVSWTVTQVGEDSCIGQIDVHRVDWDNRRAELGAWLAPAHRGRGLGRRALALVGSWLIEEVGFERVELLTQPDNASMIHAARAARFELEGVLHGYYRTPGGRVDMAIMSLVRRDLGS